jgi:hypothetical protein
MAWQWGEKEERAGWPVLRGKTDIRAALTFQGSELEMSLSADIIMTVQKHDSNSDDLVLGTASRCRDVYGSRLLM